MILPLQNCDLWTPFFASMDYFSCAGSPPSLCFGTDRLRPLGSVPPPGHLLHLFEDAAKIWPRYHNPRDFFPGWPPDPTNTAGHCWLRCLSPSAAGSDTRAEKSLSALGDRHCLVWIRRSTDASASANTCKHWCTDRSTMTANCSGPRAPSRQTLQHRRYRGTCWQTGAGTGWS